MPDLSEFDHPLTDLFPAASDPSEYLLSDEQIDFFEENGYLAGVRILDDSQVDVLRAGLFQLAQPEQAENPLFYEYNRNESEDPGHVLFHALGAWRVSRHYHDLLFHKAFTVPATQVLGGPIRFWHDQIFVKPPRKGGAVSWHQDYSYWTRTVPTAHLTCWIALDDSDLENGCVHYIPGSHKWDLLPRGGLAGDMEAIFDRLTPEQKAAFKPVPVELKKGFASFHHPMTIHGSYENLSARPRRAAVINVFLDGVKSDSDEPLLAGVPAIPKGQKIEGRFFPILS